MSALEEPPLLAQMSQRKSLRDRLSPGNLSRVRAVLDVPSKLLSERPSLNLIVRGGSPDEAKTNSSAGLKICARPDRPLSTFTITYNRWRQTPYLQGFQLLSPVE